MMEDHDLEQMQTVLQRAHTVAEVNIFVLQFFTWLPLFVTYISLQLNRNLKRNIGIAKGDKIGTQTCFDISM